MALSAARVSVTTSATVLNAADTDGMQGQALLVRNKHASLSVDLGPAAVASGAGFELAAGEAVNVDLSTGELLYAIAPSSTVTVHVLRAGT